MRATINGKSYDTAKSKTLISEEADHASFHLYQTKRGDFFLTVEAILLDGRQLKPGESSYDLAPELFSGHPVGSPERAEVVRERKSRLKSRETLIPLTAREAMVWCIKTQIPEQFRGYVLECLPAEGIGQ